MKNLVFVLFLFGLCAAACKQSASVRRESLRSEIKSLDNALRINPDVAKSKEAAKQLVEKSLRFAEEFPKDTLTPDLLFTAGEVARGAGNYGKAIQAWGQVWRHYENHSKAPISLFLQAFTFDSDLRQPEMATKYYKQFLEKYPKHGLTIEVKQLLEVVDKKPEEMVKEFEKKQK